MAKLQDIKPKHKNQFYFHTLAMNNSKVKFKKILKQYQKRINRNKFNQKNYKTWILKTSLKEIKEELSKWKDLSYSWVGRFSIINMAIFPRFKAISMKVYGEEWKEMREKTMKGLICYTKEAGLYAVNKKSIKHVK